jgi:hypothetical protein
VPVQRSTPSSPLSTFPLSRFWVLGHPAKCAHPACLNSRVHSIFFELAGSAEFPFLGPPASGRLGPTRPRARRRLSTPFSGYNSFSADATTLEQIVATNSVRIRYRPARKVGASEREIGMIFVRSLDMPTLSGAAYSTPYCPSATPIRRLSSFACTRSTHCFRRLKSRSSPYSRHRTYWVFAESEIADAEIALEQRQNFPVREMFPSRRLRHHPFAMQQWNLGQVPVIGNPRTIGGLKAARIGSPLHPSHARE